MVRTTWAASGSVGESFFFWIAMAGVLREAGGNVNKRDAFEFKAESGKLKREAILWFLVNNSRDRYLVLKNSSTLFIVRTLVVLGGELAVPCTRNPL